MPWGRTLPRRQGSNSERIAQEIGIDLDRTTACPGTPACRVDLVPLENAHSSGGRAWTTDQRRANANDLTAEQVVAVSASANRSRGHGRPTNGSRHASIIGASLPLPWVSLESRWARSVTLNGTLSKRCSPRVPPRRPRRFLVSPFRSVCDSGYYQRLLRHVR